MKKLLERIQKIDATIAWYERRREAVLREDQEYANYLDRYATFYQDEPVSITQYYELKVKLDALYGETWKDMNWFQLRQIEEIERRLAI